MPQIQYKVIRLRIIRKKKKKTLKGREKEIPKKSRNHIASDKHRESRKGGGKGI